jgi:hypothetical protein
MLTHCQFLGVFMPLTCVCSFCCWLSMLVSWVVTQCGLIGGYQHFKRMHRLHHEGENGGRGIGNMFLSET